MVGLPVRWGQRAPPAGPPEPLPKIEYLMRHEFEKGQSACRVRAQGGQQRGLGVYAHPRRFRRHRVAMEVVGKQRRLYEELAGGSNTKDQ